MVATTTPPPIGRDVLKTILIVICVAAFEIQLCS
jgi:hypothetical protein